MTRRHVVLICVYGILAGTLAYFMGVEWWQTTVLFTAGFFAGALDERVSV